MKKFYLDGTEIKVEISPTLVETLDESLDNMTLSLAINQDATPLEPLKHKIQVYDNTTLMNEFLISSDNVELVGVNPLRYKHTVSLIQTSQRLTKNLIRNTVFSTSLEENLMKKYASATVIAKISDNNDVKFQSPDPYRYISSNNVIAKVDLSKRKVKNVIGQIYFNAQIVTKSDGTGGSGNYGHIYCSYSEPEYFSFLYSNVQNAPSTLPTILFKIDQTEKRQTLLINSYKNNSTFEVDEEIASWISAQNSGILEISIENAPNSDTFMVDSCFAGESINWNPLIVNLNYTFSFETEDKKSVYSAIETLLKQYRKDTKLYHDAVDLFKMPTATHNKELYDLLKETTSPNFVFTQASMFDALAEIFKLFDATFRIDEDGYLDIEYFNERETDKKFELTDSLKAGRASSLGEERYANRLVTYFQNTKIDDKFPNSNDENATAYLRSKTLGVPGENDFVFVLPKKIDIIKRVQIKCNYKFSNPALSAIYYGFYVYLDNPSNERFIDITENVVESDIWSCLPDDEPPIGNDWNRVGKKNSLSYTKGTNYISVSDYYTTTTQKRNQVLGNVILSAINKTIGMGGTAIVNVVTYDQIPWESVKLSVDYIALVDGKLVNESINKKYDGEILTNQNNGSIDINKLGLNMVGLSLKLGQPTLTITQKFTSWADRIKKGQWFVQNGETWVANNCSYTLIDNERVQATIEFVKDFNGLASRIELNREKRLSNISNDLTTKCEENYGEFVYYCDTVSPNQAGEEIALKDQFLRNTLSLGFGKKLVDSNISTSYDASSLVIQETLNSSLDLTQYTKKNLIKLSGYAGDGVEIDNPRGAIVLWENSDLTGKSIAIPISGAAKASIYLNDITRDFEVDYYYLSTIDFNQVEPTTHIEDGDNLEVCLIVDKGTILGAVILNDSNISGITGWYDPSSIILRYPENDYRIEYALLTALNEDNSIISLEETGEVKNIAVPMVVYGSGNSICLEMSFDSPISAGNQLLYGNTSVWSAGGWFSRAVLYTNEDGEAPKFTIDFVKMQEELTRYFPAMKKSDNNEFLGTYSFGKLEEFAYYKKPNEIFALNYQLHFLPYVPTGKKQTFLSNEFIKNNGFSNGLNNKILHIIYTTEEDEDEFEYSILDTKGYGEHTVNFSIPNLQFQDTHKFQIRFDTQLTNAELDKIKTWAIVDERNNIYFASNNTPGSNGFNITFIFRHHRI